MSNDDIVHSRLEELLAELAISLRKEVSLSDIEVDQALLVQLNEGVLDPAVRRSVISALLGNEGLYQQWVEYVELNEIEHSIVEEKAMKPVSSWDVFSGWVREHVGRLLWSGGAVLVPVMALFMMNFDASPDDYIDQYRPDLVSSLQGVQIVSMRGGGEQVVGVGDRHPLLANSNFISGMFRTVRSLDTNGQLLDNWLHYTKLIEPEITDVAEDDLFLNVGQVAAAVSLLCKQETLNSSAIIEGVEIVSNMVVKLEPIEKELAYFQLGSEIDVIDACSKYQAILIPQ